MSESADNSAQRTRAQPERMPRCCRTTAVGSGESIVTFIGRGRE